MHPVFTTLIRSVRAASLIGAASALSATAVSAQVIAAPPPLGSAETFAVLGRSGVASTGATVLTGDLGVSPGGAIQGFPPGTITPGRSRHAGDAVAAMAQMDAGLASDAIAALPCPAANDFTGQDLGGRTLPPGVYCTSGNATVTGTLTLAGSGPWVFQIAGTLTTANASVVQVLGSTAVCDGWNIYWRATAAVIGAGGTFRGNLVALERVSVGTETAVDGRVIALGQDVSLDTNAVTACSGGFLYPTQSAPALTGSGQIFVPDPDSPNPSASGTGIATFGVTAIPAASGSQASGTLTYGNAVTGLAIEGPVNDVDVVAWTPENTPSIIRVSGTCALGPGCTVAAIVQDNGEPGVNDRLGAVIVSGSVVTEARVLRQVQNGTIRFFTSLTTSLNDPVLSPGETLSLSASLIPGVSLAPVDAYVVVQLPDGQFLSWTGTALVPGLVPIVRDFTPIRFSGEIGRLVIPAGTPPGTYRWLSALAQPGTLNLLTPIAETTFTITP